MKQKLFSLGIIIFLVMILSVSVFADTWQLYQFRGNECFELQATFREGNEMVQTEFILDLKNTGKINEDGEELVELSFTTKSLVALNSFLENGAADMWSGYGMSMAVMMINPMYAFFFSDLELAVGEKMSLYGAGYVKVTATETIAGREGYVCQYYQKEDDEEILVADWVIDPELGLPLRSRNFEDGELTIEMLVTNYIRY